MSQSEAFEFVLEAAFAGQPVSASLGVPFNKFLEFNDDVRNYVQGSDAKSVLHDVQVQVHDGSYLLRILIPFGLLPSLAADTDKLSGSLSLSEIDPNRTRVILRWQERARADLTLTYMIRRAGTAFPPVIVSHASVFRREDRVQWVDVERYIIGEITDWGGSQTPNVHVRPRNSRENIIVDAAEDQIRAQRENLVFHKAIVHVRAKQNPKTGELKDYRLIDLRAYRTDVEDAHLQQLFEKGAKAWAGVPDAAAWVEELRGGYNG